MARALGASGMLDIRSVSILFDVAYAGLEWIRPKPQFRKDVKTLPLRETVSFDSKESWLLLLCSVVLAALALGILHACAFLGNFGAKMVDLTVNQMTMMTTAMYATYVLTSPLACFLVKSWSPRLTATCGFLIGFLGLVLVALQIHMITHLLGLIVFLGPGCSLVQTAVCCCVVDLFKSRITPALIVLSLASPFGTLIFTSFSYYAGILALFKYKWIMLIYAILFITGIAMTRQLPRSIKIPGHQDSIKASEVANKIKQCLNAATVKQKKDERLSQQKAAQKQGKLLGEFTCTCVCFVDIGAMKDMTFILWVVITCCAMLTFYLPHVCFVSFIRYELGYGYMEALRFTWAFSVASIVGRTAAFLFDDFSFMSTRTLFQAALLGNAVAYLAMHTVETYGWMLAVYAGLGVSEGFFVTLIPRMTLHIFPRKYLASVWQLLIPTHGFSVFVGPTLIVLASNVNEGDIFLACVLVGVVQVIAAVLTFLLPEDRAEEKAALKNKGQASIPPTSRRPTALTIKVQPSDKASHFQQPAGRPTSINTVAAVHKASTSRFKT